MQENTEYDVVIVGAGAAGLMAAAHSGEKGRKVLLIEHTAKIGEKIRISGGGRCNFTNLNTSSKNFLCSNPHFVKSSLSQYTKMILLDWLNRIILLIMKKLWANYSVMDHPSKSSICFLKNAKSITLQLKGPVANFE